MDNLMVRVSCDTHGRLRDLAEASGDSMTSIVDRAVRRYQRQQFWAEYDAVYAAIVADPVASAAIAVEDALWDTASADGLEGWIDGDDSAGRTLPG